MKVSASAALRRWPETNTAQRLFTAVLKRSYENNEPINLRLAVSNTPFIRGEQRTGGTGAVLHPSSYITVQYSSFAVQQYVAAQQCSPAEAWQYSLAAPASTAQQHPARETAAQSRKSSLTFSGPAALTL